MLWFYGFTHQFIETKNKNILVKQIIEADKSEKDQFDIVIMTCYLINLDLCFGLKIVFLQFFGYKH